MRDKQLPTYDRKSLQAKNSEQKTIENHNRDNKQLEINDCKSLQETTLSKINRKSLQETTLSKININHDKRQHLAK